MIWLKTFLKRMFWTSFVMVFLTVVGSVRGQTTATLVGTVKDASGATIPGATVVARHIESNEERQGVTNDQGDYRISLQRIGLYTVRAEMPGFKTTVLPEVMVRIGQTARLDLSLEVGEISESLTVTGAAPLVRTESVSLAEVMDNRKILELPLNGREFLQLATLTPGVSSRNPRLLAACRTSHDESHKSFVFNIDFRAPESSIVENKGLTGESPTGC